MAGCCAPDGYDELFGARFSGRLLTRYRRRGLDRTATHLVARLVELGIEGASVLEIGGGIGDVQVELLRRGAARATSVELVGAYDEDAAALAAEAGVADRMTRVRADLAATPEAVDPHEVVVLHRVVCCYHDHAALLGAAADHATRLLAFTHPPRGWLTRTYVAAQNLGFRLKGTPFRTHLHRPDDMLRVLEARGLRVVHRHRGAVWRVVVLTRADDAASPIAAQ